MSSYGFVYLLTNDYMPNVYKVGCTERSPHTRAEELSKATGVPAPFQVLCYIEVEDFQRIERELHKWLEEWRISPDREFFHGGLEYAVRLLYWLPRRLTFSVPQPANPQESFLWQIPGLEDVGSLAQSLNPWARSTADAEQCEPAASLLKLISNAASRGSDE